MEFIVAMIFITVWSLFFALFIEIRRLSALNEFMKRRAERDDK